MISVAELSPTGTARRTDRPARRQPQAYLDTCHCHSHAARPQLGAALIDFVLLAVLCGLGAYGGIALLHVIAPPRSHVIVTLADIAAFAYAGASLSVGFGLVQNVLRRSVFRVTGPVGLLVALVLSEVFGVVGIVPVILWRTYRLVAAVRS